MLGRQMPEFGSFWVCLPVARSSGESVCRASMIREKVPWGQGRDKKNWHPLPRHSEPWDKSGTAWPQQTSAQVALGRVALCLSSVFIFLKEMGELFKEWFPGVFF